MAKILNIDHRVLAISAIAVTGGLAIYSTVKLWLLNRKHKKQNVYENVTSLHEYLLFHYGTPEQLIHPWEMFIDKNYINFPKKCAELCLKYCDQKERLNRALDVGCGVGRSTFELCKVFSKVTGIDYSNLFIDSCKVLKTKGYINFSTVIEGDIDEPKEALVDPLVDRNRVEFLVGDACCLPLNLGQFDLVLAANLICRLHSPLDFLHRLNNLVSEGGILVITSPYTFSKTYTSKELWIGGYKSKSGENIYGFDGLKEILSESFILIAEENLPFLIRETNRKYQLTISHALVWRKK